MGKLSSNCETGNEGSPPAKDLEPPGELGVHLHKQIGALVDRGTISGPGTPDSCDCPSAMASASS